MIITRSPLRVSLGGGGTDLPSYYEQHGGFLIAAAIDKYVCITLHQTFVDELILKYSRTERVRSVDAIEHPIIRESMRWVGVPPERLEITSSADIPAGTGLGSSGSFTTALLKSLYNFKHQSISPRGLAEAACQIEINKLGEPIGKQDQYVAAFGGINSYTFQPDGQVLVEPLPISDETLYNLEDHLLLYFTGYSRSASSILSDQDRRTKTGDLQMIDQLHYVKELGYRSQEALLEGDLSKFAAIMHEHWLRKRQRSQGMTNSTIDRWYESAREHGALGGKIIGAGGGGFLMLYAEDKTRLRRAMREANLREVRFRFDFEGTRVVQFGSMTRVAC